MTHRHRRFSGSRSAAVDDRDGGDDGVEGADKVVRPLDARVPERGGEGGDGGGGVAKVDDELGEDAVRDAEVGLQLLADLGDMRELREPTHQVNFGTSSTGLLTPACYLNIIS